MLAGDSTGPSFCVLTLSLHRFPAVRLLPTALALLALMPSLAVAQAQGIVLRSSPRLQEQLSPAEAREGVGIMEAERMQARPDMDVVLEGGVVLRRPGMVLRADRVEYDQTREHVSAQGNVRINRQGNRFDGPAVELQMDSFQGHFESPRYQSGCPSG